MCLSDRLVACSYVDSVFGLEGAAGRGTPRGGVGSTVAEYVASATECSDRGKPEPSVTHSVLQRAVLTERESGGHHLRIFMNFLESFPPPNIFDLELDEMGAGELAHMES